MDDWAAEARAVEWVRPFDTLHVPDIRGGRWFVRGRLNVAANCLDRHLTDHGERVAIHWEGEPGDRQVFSYRRLHAEVCRFAAALHGLGVRAGDRVALYMGWLPETVVAMLACARLGAVHALLPAPLPADGLADRLADLAPKVLVTQDGSWRHGVVLPLKARADEALAAVTGVQHTIVVRRTGVDVTWFEGDRWYHDLMTAAPQHGHAQPVDADHPLLVVYLANQRGRPAGVVHASGGLLVYAAALHRRGLAVDASGVFWCAVDIAWLAGQTHGVYGPLACGTTAVMFEGMLDTPTRDRAWQIIERYGVGALVTTPSVVRSLHGWAEQPPGERVSSVRRIVTLGEAIDARSRAWLAEDLGRGRASVADGWGQTELGGIVTLDPDPGLPDPGTDIVDREGRPLPPGERGELVLRKPWPGTFLGLLGDDVRVAARYWSQGPVYATGDEAVRAADGTLKVLGRLDPIFNVSGQLVSAAEVRAVLLDHPSVAAAEVVERPDRRSGQAVVACVVLRGDAEPSEPVARELQDHVHETLGGLAQPRAVAFCASLPADVPRAVLRRGLRMLCASQRGETLRLSDAQIRAAAEAAAAPSAATHQTLA